METIQGIAEIFERFHFSLPLTGMIFCTAVFVALLAKGQFKHGLILFGSFFLYQVFTANQGVLVNTVNTVQTAGDSSGLLMGFTAFSMGTLVLLGCLSMMQGRN